MDDTVKNEKRTCQGFDRWCNEPATDGEWCEECAEDNNREYYRNEDRDNE